jgi:hypothetical protein
MSTNKPFLMLQIYDHFSDLGEQKPKEVLVDQNETIIGRSLESDLILSSETISLKHAKIYFDQYTSSWFIEDLKSQNGIFFNDNKIEKKKIEDHDQFYFGESLIISKLNSLNLEKTRSFSILVEKKKTIGFKDFLYVFMFALFMILVNYKTSYYVTEMKFYESIGIFVMVTILSSLFSLAFSWISQKKFNLAIILKFNFLYWCSLFFYDLLQDIFITADFVWLRTILFYLSAFSFFFLLPFVIKSKTKPKVLILRSLAFTFLVFGMQLLNEMNKGKTHLEIPYVVSFSNKIQLKNNSQALDGKIDETFKLIELDYEKENQREKAKQ